MNRVGMTAPEMARNACTINRTEVRLYPVQARMLVCLLLSHPDKWLGRDELALAMWGIKGGPLVVRHSIKRYANMLRSAGVPLQSNGRNSGWKGYRIPAEARGPSRPDRIRLRPSPRLKVRLRHYLIVHRQGCRSVLRRPGHLAPTGRHGPANKALAAR
jgi:hypothetical protein